MQLLSIDFGTTNTVGALATDGQTPRTVEFDASPSFPSAVFVAADGTVSVGRDAVRQARLDPSRYEPNPKRRIDDGDVLLGDRVVTVVELITEVLRYVHTEVRRQLGPMPVDEVRLTHPAGWGPTRQNVLLTAARAAGLGNNLVLVPEPVAAAAQYTRLPGRELLAGAAVAVYDLGGEKLDVAVVGRTLTEFIVLAEDGLSDLGGLDFDQAVLDQVGRTVSTTDPSRWQHILRPGDLPARRAARALAEDVRAAKESLSRHSQTEVPLPEAFQDVHLTRIEFEGLIRPSVVRSVEVLAAAIGRSGVPAQLLAGIFLVGGSSRIPLVATVIQRQLGVTPVALDQPETAVALGALLVGGRREGQRTQHFEPAVGQQRPPFTTGPRVGPVPTTGPRVGPVPVAVGWQAEAVQASRRRRSKGRWWIGGAALAVVVAAALVLVLVKPFSTDRPANPATFAADVESGMRAVRTVTGTLDSGTGTQASLRETLKDGRLQAAEIVYTVNTSGESVSITVRIAGGKSYLGGAGVQSLLPSGESDKQWVLLDAGSSNSVISTIGASLGGLLSNVGTDSYVYLLRGATSVTAAGADPVGAIGATRYAVVIDVQKAAAALPSDLASYRTVLSVATGAAQASYWTDSQHRLVKADITMTGSTGAQRTALTVASFNDTFTIDAPDPSTVYTG